MTTTKISSLLLELDHPLHCAAAVVDTVAAKCHLQEYDEEKEAQALIVSVEFCRLADPPVGHQSDKPKDRITTKMGRKERKLTKREKK